MVYVCQVVAPCDAKWTSYDQGKRERQNQGGADESWQIHFLEISTKLCEQISVVCLFPANSRVDDFATKKCKTVYHSHTYISDLLWCTQVYLMLWLYGI